MTCGKCGAEFAPGLLLCPSCHALVHADELKGLATDAETQTRAGDWTKALEFWRRALELLPAGSAQHTAITQKIGELVRRIDESGGLAREAPKKPKWAQAGTALGVIGLLLWKFKFLLVFLLTKAKVLLLGLTKASTFFSMLLAVGVYWSIWGWKFALGVVLSIYVHEMGHVYRLSRYGIKATAPMFIPGFGAVIRQKQYPASPHEDARVGLAGPLWGLVGCGVTYAIHLATKLEIFAAIAQFAAWINLFNLLPVWQLDGSHAFRALSRMERGIIAALMWGLWIYTEEGLLVLLALVATFRAFSKNAPLERDNAILTEFGFILITLSLLSQIEVITR